MFAFFMPTLDTSTVINPHDIVYNIAIIKRNAKALFKNIHYRTISHIKIVIHHQIIISFLKDY